MSLNKSFSCNKLTNNIFCFLLTFNSLSEEGDLISRMTNNVKRNREWIWPEKTKWMIANLITTYLNFDWNIYQLLEVSRRSMINEITSWKFSSFVTCFLVSFWNTTTNDVWTTIFFFLTFSPAKCYRAPVEVECFRLVLQLWTYTQPFNVFKYSFTLVFA